jgi:hypothetical protein
MWYLRLESFLIEVYVGAATHLDGEHTGTKEEKVSRGLRQVNYLFL